MSLEILSDGKWFICLITIILLLVLLGVMVYIIFYRTKMNAHQAQIMWNKISHGYAVTENPRCIKSRSPAFVIGTTLPPCNGDSTLCDVSYVKSECHDIQPQLNKCTYPTHFCPGDFFYNMALQSLFIYSNDQWIPISQQPMAEFYAIMPSDNNTSLSPVPSDTFATSLLLPGDVVKFPNVSLSPSQYLSIQRLSDSSFRLAAGGRYEIKTIIPVDIDLLAHLSIYANNMTFGGSTMMSPYSVIANGSFAFNRLSPATIFTPHENPPSVSDSVWYGNATETLVAQQLVSALITAILSQSVVIIPTLNNITLTPGSYMMLTTGVLAGGSTLEFKGDGYYFIQAPEYTFDGTMILSDGAKASKIYWLARTAPSGNAYDIGFSTNSTVVVHGYFLAVIGNFRSNTFNRVEINGSVLLQNGEVRIVISLVVRPQFYTSIATTEGYASPQIILRVNDVEQVSTLTSASDVAGTISMNHVISTIEENSDAIIEIAIPRKKSNGVQLYRYLTNLLAPSDETIVRTISTLRITQLLT